MLELGEGVEAPAAERRAPVLINASSWLRSPEGGVFRTTKRIGDGVSVGEVVGHVANPYEDVAVEVRSPRRGIIIGRTTLPIVNMGDALLNIGWSEEIADHTSPEREVLDEPVDEDEIVD
jgi:predicted deacylase